MFVWNCSSSNYVQMDKLKEEKNYHDSYYDLNKRYKLWLKKMLQENKKNVSFYLVLVYLQNTHKNGFLYIYLFIFVCNTY